MLKNRQDFGGQWTSEKLSLLEKYLIAYSKIMNQQEFCFA